MSWGGAYTESQKLGYGDPTAAKLGIPVNWVDYTGGLSEIKAQKEAGAITWDIMDVYAKDTIIGCDEGITVTRPANLQNGRREGYRLTHCWPYPRRSDLPARWLSNHARS